MKKIKLITIVFLVIINTISAQIKLSGIVKDSIGNTLEMVNMIAINKQTNKLDSYGFTDANGNYKLNLKENSSYIIKVSYVGMKARSITVVTKEKDIFKNI